MAKTSHIPGPWEYDKRMGVGTTVDGSRISTWINTPSWGDGGINVIFRNGLEFTKAEANARLIAAAPELLLACEGVLGVLNHGTPTKEDGTPNTHWKHIDIIRAAIAKATGWAGRLEHGTRL